MARITAVKKFDELIEECEANLRAGRSHQLRLRLAELNSSRLPASYRLTFARFCRRAGLNRTGLRLLTPAVHPERKLLGTTPSDATMAEYALLLSRAGSVQEAMWTLNQVDASAAPEADLFRAQLHFGRWEYAEALPALRAYLAAPLALYQQLIGNVNLAAALVNTQQFSEAILLLDQNIRVAEAGQYKRLWANCLELKAEAYIQMERYELVRPVLANALQLLEGQVSDDYHFYLMAWQAILEGLEQGDSTRLIEVREEALARNLWEKVREIDLYICKIEARRPEGPSDQTQRRFEHLIFGTPFPHFRERAIRETGLVVDAEYFILGSFNSPCMNLETGKIAGRRGDLNAGKKIHRLFDVILRDFYRPASLGSLFSEICPEERFQVSSSPDRIHQLMSRSRAWLKENDIPVRLDGTQHQLKLVIEGKFSFRVPLHRAALSPWQANWARLLLLFPIGSVFTAKDAKTALGLKPSTFKNLILWARQERLVQQHGQSVSAKYQVLG